MPASVSVKRSSLEIIHYPDGNRVFALNGRMIATYHATVVKCSGSEWVGLCRGWNYSIIGICGDKLFVRHHPGALATKEDAEEALDIQKKFFIKQIKNEIERSIDKNGQPES